MSLEDLAFCKIVRWEPQDIEDFEAILSKNALDIDFLDYLIYNEEEARGAGMSDRNYSQTLFNYKQFKERFHLNDNDGNIR